MNLIDQGNRLKTIRKNIYCTLVFALTMVGPTHAQTDPQPSYNNQPNSSHRPKNPLVAMYLIPMVAQKVGGLLGDAIEGGLTMLKNSFSSNSSANKQDLTLLPLEGQAQLNLPANSENGGFIPAPPPITQEVKAVAGVLYLIDRLNPDSSVRETISPQIGVSPAFQSGERFAVRYTSNFPGVVVFLNIDAQKKTSYLGTFVVKNGVEMRFPEPINKGMRLDDNIGSETYQMLFVACIPPNLSNQLEVAELQGKIPNCGTISQAEQTVMLAQKGRRTKGTYSEALQQADGTNKVVLSVAPYEKGDVTVTTFSLDHIAPIN